MRYSRTSISFTKGNNFHEFLFSSQDEVALPNRGYSLRKEFAPRGANSFLLELTPVENRGKRK